MHLREAIGLQRGDALAFVGAGGKTSAMFALARELEPPIILTTTTHLGAWQVGPADVHYILKSSADIHGIDFVLPKIMLITGPAAEDARLGGVSEKALAQVYQRCKELKVPLLIEADGARQRSLKAPAAYEPVIPQWVSGVVVMSGLGGLGKPLDGETVHRPEIFAEMSGCELGAPVSAAHLKAVLTSKQGGLKGIPEGAQRIVFLNQAEGNRLEETGFQLARDLIDAYDRVLVGSMSQPGEDGPVFSVHTQTAGVILAAGGSERLGQPKQLLDWDGVPFIRQIALNAIEAGLAPLIAVTGAERERIANALAGLEMICVHNPDWERGQSTSMQAGLSALPPDVDSVLFLLSDQPQIGPDLIRQLLARYAAHRQPITAPRVRGQRANPVLFSEEAFEALQKVTGDRGGRVVFEQFEVDWLDWEDARILLDVDKPGDYRRLLAAYDMQKSNT